MTNEQGVPDTVLVMEQASESVSSSSNKSSSVMMIREENCINNKPKQQPMKQDNDEDEESTTVVTESTKAVDDTSNSAAPVFTAADHPPPPINPTTTTTAQRTNSTKINVTKTLTTLLKIPSNRSCGDCRSALVDPSQVHASFCPRRLQDFSLPADISITDFSLTHQAFAPPHLQKETARKYGTDPALLINQRFGGHGVFLCAPCAKAHALLPASITVVHPVQQLSPPVTTIDGGGSDHKNNNKHNEKDWTELQVKYMLESGGNARSWQVYEQYMPESWKKRRPSPASSLSDRLVFVRAKYEALAFCMPPPGPLSHVAWCKILERHSEFHHYISLELKSYQHLSPTTKDSSITNAPPTKKTDTTTSKDKVTTAMGSRGRGSTGEELPNRLVDFFCVVSSDMQLVPVPSSQKAQQQAISSIEELCFVPHVSDCYPSRTSHSDTEFPTHLGTFVLPEGCHARSQPIAPTFYTVALTTADGSRLYGAVLQIWDEAHDMDYIRTAVLDSSGYSEEDLPRCLSTTHEGYHPDAVVFFPKCLVILSHHPFFDVYREILVQLYRITLVEAPLPIERYIANFASEVPLPPPGRIKVEFGFTSDRVLTIERPPLNQLPLTNFSFRPLFATLSAGNIITVIACLLQECRITIVSKHYSLLCPVTEALLSFLFPFSWQGLYIPVLPYAMTDCLEAPVPFLIGLHSRYLQETAPSKRPHGVIFVDLDRDVVHLGFDDNGHNRELPSLPSRDVLKLKASLNEFGSSVYLIPDSGIEGCIVTGDSLLMTNKERQAYAQMSNIEVNSESLGRTEVFSITDKAYRDGDLTAAVSGFRTVHGHLEEDSDEDGQERQSSSSKSNATVRPLRRKVSLFQRSKKNSSMEDYDKARAQGHLLEMAEPPGFSAKEIRNAFLRFLVAIFKGYQSFLLAEKHDLFDEDEFVDDLQLSEGNLEFLQEVLKTQLFQRFLEERRDNPGHPEMRFFDESIIAKNNRSKKHTLTTGGKKPTPFLDDDSGKVTKTFTPPPPSNLGLPDDDRMYHYGSFPPLDQSLFGRVRPPQLWPEMMGRSSKRLRLPSTVQKTQNDIVKKAMKPMLGAQASIMAMKPMLGAPASIMMALTKRSGKDLESALSALSPVVQASIRKDGTARGDTPNARLEVDTSAANDSLFSGGIKSGTLVNTLSKAETLILNARRKQGILLGLVISMQACWRRHIVRLKYTRFRRAVIKLQRAFLRPPGCKKATTGHKELQKRSAVVIQRSVRRCLVRRESELQNLSAVIIQRSVRRCLVRRELELQKLSAVIIQRSVRRCLVRRELTRRHDAVGSIQRYRRGRVARRKFSALRQAAIIVQKLTRMRRIQYMFMLTRNLVSLVQSRVRGIQVRKRFKIIMDRRQVIYKWQILSLWHTTRTSLAFRTKLWPTLAMSWSFLHLRVSETELFRLWELMCVPVNLKEIEKKSWDDEALKLADFLGVNTVAYRWCLHMAGMIQEGHSFDTSTTTLKTALDVETAERLQIYERLSSTSPEALSTLYKDFEIPSNEAKKKLHLAKCIWTTHKHVGKSVSAMMVLFPELEGSLNIFFHKPSSKAQRRFPNAHPVVSPPVDKSMWESVSLEELVKKHLQDVAVVIFTKVPDLMAKIVESEKNKEASFRLRREAVMGTRQISDWKECRSVLLGDYLAGRYRPQLLESQKEIMTSDVEPESSSPVLPDANFPDMGDLVPDSSTTTLLEAKFPNIDLQESSNLDQTTVDPNFPNIDLREDDVATDPNFPDIDMNLEGPSASTHKPEEGSSTTQLTAVDAKFPEIDMIPDVPGGSAMTAGGAMSFPDTLFEI